MWTTAVEVGVVLLHLAFMGRAILRPHRDPESRIAWVVAIAVLPIAGIGAYILFGETNIGRKRAERAAAALATMPPAIPATSLHASFPTVIGVCFDSGRRFTTGRSSRSYL